MMWLAVGITCVGCYLIKLSGLVAPAGILERPRVARAVDMLPPALLASLLVTQAAASGQHLVADARLAGLAVALGLLLLRAPLALVVVAAAAAAAVVRLVTG